MGRREGRRRGGAINIMRVDLGQMGGPGLLAWRGGSTSTHCSLDIHHSVVDVGSLLAVSFDGIRKTDGRTALGILISFQHVPSRARCDLLVFLHLGIADIPIVKSGSRAPRENKRKLSQRRRKGGIK